MGCSGSDRGKNLPMLTGCEHGPGCVWSDAAYWWDEGKNLCIKACSCTCSQANGAWDWVGWMLER